MEEIRALAVPPIPWDIALGHWFDEQFPPVEVRHTYARASRRQASSPEIPRPGRAIRESEDLQRTFGMLIATSGSAISATRTAFSAARIFLACSDSSSARSILFCTNRNFYLDRACRYALSSICIFFSFSQIILISPFP